MKKILVPILSALIILIISVFFWYNANLKSISADDTPINFVIESGTSTKQIIANLKDADLIRSEFVTLIYAKLNKEYSFKSGTFTLNRKMDIEDIFEALNDGTNSRNTFQITFKEGVTLKRYVEQIASKLDKSTEELITEINSEEFLEPFVEKYWFLTIDILNPDIYYPLEGYLYPNTYEFFDDATLTDIVDKMLKETEKKLEEYKEDIEESEYSVHEILAMASIIEKEAISEEDRATVSQVIYKRLSLNMSLGMDVTSYYGAGKDMTDILTNEELYDENPYNTRVPTFKGLPAGPICNSSISSIRAALNPADTDYVYFYADIDTKKVYFTETYEEFQEFIKLYGN